MEVGRTCGNVGNDDFVCYLDWGDGFTLSIFVKTGQTVYFNYVQVIVFHLPFNKTAKIVSH